MNTAKIKYFAPWNDVISVVCPEINEYALKLGDLLDAKDIPFEYCVVEEEPAYDGKVALVLTGVEGIRHALSGDVEEAYVFDYEAATVLVENQKYGQLIVNNVDYVAVSDLFQKLVILDDFDAFCRGEYISESANVSVDDDFFPTDEFNDTESVSDAELNQHDDNDPFADKVRLMDAAQHAAFKVYEMYEKAIDALFAKDPNHK